MAFHLRNPRLARYARFVPCDLNRELHGDAEERLLDRTNRALRRRLSDRIQTVFQATCAAGDLETAADLLIVLTNSQERGGRGGERRISDDPVANARQELATHKLAKLQQAS
jgi:hypothetical protein